MTRLITHNTYDCPKAILSNIDSKYYLHLNRGYLQLYNDYLVYFKPILMEIIYIALLVVPTGLQRQLVSHYYVDPRVGHMGEYKIPYCLQSRFFWPKTREDIKQWVAKYAHCVAYHMWSNRKSELYFSWPITTPFWIIHTDLWIPGNHAQNRKGNTCYLLNLL